MGPNPQRKLRNSNLRQRDDLGLRSPPALACASKAPPVDIDCTHNSMVSMLTFDPPRWQFMCHRVFCELKGIWLKLHVNQNLTLWPQIPSRCQMHCGWREGGWREGGCHFCALFSCLSVTKRKRFFSSRIQSWFADKRQVSWRSSTRMFVKSIRLKKIETKSFSPKISAHFSEFLSPCLSRKMD